MQSLVMTRSRGRSCHCLEITVIGKKGGHSVEDSQELSSQGVREVAREGVVCGWCQQGVCRVMSAGRSVKAGGGLGREKIQQERQRDSSGTPSTREREQPALRGRGSWVPSQGRAACSKIQR